jgi:hypothetical protein
MRGFLIFILFLAAVFFAVGEWQGWYLGIPGRTPIFVYKKTYTSVASRQLYTAKSFAFKVDGHLSRGSLTVEGTYKYPGSFQDGTQARPERVIFSKDFHAGQAVHVSKEMAEGVGIYRVKLIFEGATGTFRETLPPAGTL